MRYIVIFLSLIVSCIVCGSQLDSQRFDVINTLDDSIKNIIEGKKFLYYTQGHHGHIWSLAVSEKSNYIIVSGNTRNNDCNIDTITIDESILKWGLDSLASYSHKMKPVKRSYYWPSYTRLVLFSSQKDIIFDCENTDTYNGTDSVTFNEKLNNLKYLMFWLATPMEIRKKLPAPQ